MSPLTKNGKKIPLLPTIIINRSERSCDILKRRRAKNPLSSTTLSQFAQKKRKEKTNNDHGADVNIILVI
jgi:hypothetical protein